MPVLGTYGAMSVRGWRTGVPPYAIFRSTALTNNAQFIVKPAGLAVDDIVIIVTAIDSGAASTVFTTGGAVWAVQRAANGNYACFTKVMTALDIANTWDCTTAVNYMHTTAFMPKGASNVQALAPTESIGSTTLTVPGSSLAGDRTIVSVYIDDIAATGAVPTGFIDLGIPQSFGFTQLWTAKLTGNYVGANIVFTSVPAGYRTRAFTFKFV